MNSGREPRTPSPSRLEGNSSVASSPERPVGPLSIPVPVGDREMIKVNNANLNEMKHALDDALKRVSHWLRTVWIGN